MLVIYIPSKCIICGDLCSNCKKCFKKELEKENLNGKTKTRDANNQKGHDTRFPYVVT